MKLPSFQFYPGDWQKDANLRRCSKAEKGMWIDMLCLAFECEERGKFISNGQPWTPDEIAEAVGGNPKSNQKLFQKLLKKGIVKRDDSGTFFSSRMVKDEAKRKKSIEDGQKGGNPTLKGGVNHNSTPMVNPSANPKQTPSSSSSSLSPSLKSKSKDTEGAIAPPASKFSKPTLDEVKVYCLERHNRVDADAFLSHYDSNGWRVGKNPMRNWQAAVRTWEKNDYSPNTNGVNKSRFGAATAVPGTYAAAAVSRVVEN